MSKLTEKEAQIKKDNIVKEQQLNGFLMRGINSNNNMFEYGHYMRTFHGLKMGSSNYSHFIVTLKGIRVKIEYELLYTIGQTTDMYDSRLNEIYENDLFKMAESNKTGIVKRSLNNEWVIHYRTDDEYNRHLLYSEDGYSFDMKLENHCYTGSVVGNSYFGLINENS